jgi:hypothetical protein
MALEVIARARDHSGVTRMAIKIRRSKTKVLRDERGRWLKGTPPPNPAGRPSEGQSWQEILRWAAELTGAEAASLSPDQLAREFRKLGKLKLKEAISLRVFAALLFDPTSGLFNAVMDRAEGKLAQPVAVMDWRAELEKHGISASEVFENIVRSAAAALVRPDDGRGGADGAGSAPPRGRSVAGERNLPQP